MEDKKIYTSRLQKCADYIKSVVGSERPVAAIVLGSGLGKLADRIQDKTVIPYSDIPGFPVSTAVGHKSNFIYGKLGGKTVVAMQGRFHYYEGYPMEDVTIGVRVMKLLGVEYIFVSNAAGSCNPDYKVGDLVIIRDHINMIPNPLIGPNLDTFGERFPDMTCAYDLQLQALAEGISCQHRTNLRDSCRSKILSLHRSGSFGHVHSSGSHSGPPLRIESVRHVSCDQLFQFP